MTWVDVVAIWGAALSTVLGMFKIAEYRKDRPKLHVSLEPDYEDAEEFIQVGASRIYVLVRVVNVGRRPITVTGVRLLLPRASEQRHLWSLEEPINRRPEELPEGRMLEVAFVQDEITGLGVKPSQVVACVLTATGKMYWSHGILARLCKTGRVR